MIALNLLWHFHQPDYRHPADGVPVLPWVRLHAAKGYRDLLDILQAQAAAQVTVNFSGVLLEQLRAYCDGLDDTWAQVSAIPAADLDSSSRELVWRNFFSANTQTLIKPHARYSELQLRHERWRQSDGFAETPEELSAQDLTDLMVWFNLAWIGFTGQRHSGVRELTVRGRGFSHADQLQVLELQRELAREVLPGYRKLAEAGRIELSVTPLNHPILPLLVDLAAEGHADPDNPLPQFSYVQDAEQQVQHGSEAYARCFGHPPAGMWPAEGSVSDAALAVFASAGLQWVATDQANLPAGDHGKLPHLQPWLWERDGKSIHVFFRDTRLSDNIGFEYARWQPVLAGQHLVHMVRQLGEQAERPQPVVTIALDGENPWEAYADGGQGFLNALFDAIAADEQVQCVLPSQVIANADWPQLGSIHSGSWIFGNFDIWTRHADTRRAWRLMARARADLALQLEQPAVYGHLLAAESSDWFWWYGDDFTSTQAWQFDELCRGHLIAAYRAANLSVPPELFDPIVTAGSQSTPTVSGLIEPHLDGRVTSFYEWRGAVCVSGDGHRGSMARASHNGVSELCYGFSADSMWLRIDCAADWHSGMAEHGARIRLSIEHPSVSFSFEADSAQSEGGGPLRLAVGDIVELQLPLSAVAALRGQDAGLSIDCLRGDGLECRVPASGVIMLHLLSADEAASLWSV